ncbi:hypothetical protein D3C87_223070 [compost metagenome]|jgi:hypothetical protein
MYIVAIAWIYVVFMMAITETSVVAGIMTFLLYGVVPVTIIVYVMGSGRRKRKRHAQEMQRRAEIQKAEETKAAASEAAPES